MHTHLVTFQVVGQTPFDVNAYRRNSVFERRSRWDRSDPVRDRGRCSPPTRRNAASRIPSRSTPGPSRPSGEIRFAERRVSPQTYVHHCHIVEHEDNDMMRPFTVT